MILYCTLLYCTKFLKSIGLHQRRKEGREEGEREGGGERERQKSIYVSK